MQFPDNREFDVFLALTLHALGQHGESTKLLLLTLADTSEDPGITAYQRAIRFQATGLSKREKWPARMSRPCPESI